jgi:exonuclease SbcD
VEVQSRDGSEAALIAAIPWINEREAVFFEELGGETGVPLVQYAERVSSFLAILAERFRAEPEKVSVLLGHLFVDSAKVGHGGGERELHLNQHIYGVNAAQLPSSVQYTALGHVHKPQIIREVPPVAYSGSLLQLDFGEREQDKYVNLVEIHPRAKAIVTPLAITAGRKLIDIGSPLKGVNLNQLTAYVEQSKDAWFRVFVETDAPVANLADEVRRTLPSTVDVVRVSPTTKPVVERETLSNLGPFEMFSRYYESVRAHEPSSETLDLFRQLLTEEEHAPTEA